MTPPERYHVPVMLDEVIDALKIDPDGTYVDCTFGGGGHSVEILSRLGAEGRLIAFDQDADAKANVPDDGRVTFVPHNFRYLYKFLRLYDVIPVNGILADLGVSSFQIDHASRGFSTRYDGKLDMRMDRKNELTAADVLNKRTAKDLQTIFQNYGEVTNAKTLSEEIVHLRTARPFETLGDLNGILNRLSKGNPNRYFAQVYQAIRIEVNDELGALSEMLQQAADVLAPGGRLAVLTFHSIEDRLVKNFYKYGNTAGERKTDVFGNTEMPKLKVVNKKPLLPSDKEMETNPRSRSAKLRVAEKMKEK